MDIEKTAKLTDGNFWFQLYNPKDKNLRKDILKRATIYSDEDKMKNFKPYIAAPKVGKGD